MVLMHHFGVLLFLLSATELAFANSLPSTQGALVSIFLVFADFADAQTCALRTRHALWHTLLSTALQYQLCTLLNGPSCLRIHRRKRPIFGCRNSLLTFIAPIRTFLVLVCPLAWSLCISTHRHSGTTRSTRRFTRANDNIAMCRRRQRSFC